MLFGKKEDKSELPDLPSSRASVNVKPLMGSPEKGKTIETSLPELPEVPPLESAKAEPVERFPEPLPRPEPKAQMVEMQEWQPSSEFPEEEEVPEHTELEEVEEEIEPLPIAPPPTRPARAKEKPADVFVRIDKFHSARKALTEIEDRLADIDDLVKKIRETKLREEQELSSWEKDITHIQARVQTVTENIFEKVE